LDDCGESDWKDRMLRKGQPQVVGNQLADPTCSAFGITDDIEKRNCFGKPSPKSKTGVIGKTDHTTKFSASRMGHA